jgi:hypothetical protein
MAGNGLILMTRENPQGHKLEDLLAQIAHELTVKNNRLRGDSSAAAQTLAHNNVEIISRLHECRRLQEHSLKVLETVGPDQGPTGKPRVGEGS